jgi:hypothetical protein
MMIKPIEKLQLLGSGVFLVTPNSSPLLFPYEYIWVFFAAINLLNLAYIKFRMAAIVRNNRGLERESRIVMKWFFIFSVLPFLLLALLQYLGGFHHAFYLLSNNYHNPYIVLGWAVVILLDMSLLYAMLLGGGATLLIKFHQAFPRIQKNETMIKLGTVLGVIGSLISFFIMITTNTAAKFHS